MIKYGTTYSYSAPATRTITSNKVFIASDITSSLDEDNQVLYTYKLTEYTKDEYISLLSDNLEQQILETQLALCDIYEELGG